MEARLRQFVRLVDAGSFVRAARELHISQPALSVAIAKLEREVHAPLLVHGVRPLSLTAAGKLAYATGKDMLQTANNLRTQLAELEGRQVSVSVGMIDSVAGALLLSPQTIGGLEQQAVLSLVIDNSRNLLRAVESAELDLAFVVGRPQVAPGLEVTHVGVEPLVLVCHPGQSTFYARTLQKGTLPHFISYDQASTTGKLVLTFLQQHGVVTTTSLYSTSPDVMLRLAMLQKGVAALPYLQVRDQLRAGGLCMVRGPGLVIERNIYAVSRRGAVLPKVLGHSAERIGNLLQDIQLEAQVICSQS